MAIIDWRVILDDGDATSEAIAEKVRDLTWNGIRFRDDFAPIIPLGALERLIDSSRRVGRVGASDSRG